MHDDTPATSAPPPSRALVLSRAPSPDSVRPAPRPLAAFVIQLVACEAGLAPFRRSRRSDPAEGAASYEACGHAGSDAGAPARFERVL